LVLELTNGRKGPQEIELKEGKNRIGSARSNELSFKMKGMAFKHALVRFKSPNTVTVEHLAKNAQTLIGTTPLRVGDKTPLNVGDELVLGSAIFKLGWATVDTLDDDLDALFAGMPDESAGPTKPREEQTDEEVFLSSGLALQTLGPDASPDAQAALAGLARRSGGLFDLVEKFPLRARELAFATVRAEHLPALLDAAPEGTDYRLHKEQDAREFVAQLRELIKSVYLPEPMHDWLYWDEQEELFLVQRQDPSGMTLVARNWDLLVCLPQPIEGTGPRLARLALRQLMSEDAGRLVPDESVEVSPGVWRTVFRSSDGLLGHRYEEIIAVTDGLVLAVTLRPRFAIEAMPYMGAQDRILELIKEQEQRAIFRRGPNALPSKVQPMPPGGRYGRARQKRRGRYEKKR
jgi:hypothetical protein